MCKVDSNPKYKKTDEWVKRTTDFNNRMVTDAYGIRTKSAAYQQKLEQQFGVKMASEDEAFYQNICHGKYKTTCSSTVCKKW